MTIQTALQCRRSYALSSHADPPYHANRIPRFVLPPEYPEYTLVRLPPSSLARFVIFFIVCACARACLPVFTSIFPTVKHVFISIPFSSRPLHTRNETPRQPDRLVSRPRGHLRGQQVSGLEGRRVFPPGLVPLAERDGRNAATRNSRVGNEGRWGEDEGRGTHDAG